MRQQFHKLKSNPFSTVTNRKSKAQNQSIEEYELIESFNNNQKLISEPALKAKNRQKSFSRRRESNFKGQIALNTSLGDLGKELKDKRSLIEQNEELKKKIETLILSKPSRKKTPTNKILTQFEKQMYWNGSQSYMISGIKLQYQKMKESLIKKNEAYDQLMRSTPVSKNMQLLTYVQTLQVQNFIISRKLQSLAQKSNNEDRLMIMELQDRIASYQASYTQQRKINKKRKSQIKKLNSKITFLQTLIITKDNNEHNANKQLKKIQKQKLELDNKIKVFQQQIYQMKKEHLKQVQKIQSRNKQHLQLQLKKIASNHKQQHQLMLRLQRQNRYLQSLVQSWKAEKIPQKDHKQHRHHHNNNHYNSTLVKQSLNKSKYEPVVEKTTPRKAIEKDFQFFKKQNTQEVSLQSAEQANRRMIPYSPDNKNSENSIKNRRIQAYQIEEIVQFSRYKMIAHEQSLQWIINQFQGSRQDQWQRQYISMGQARNTLQTKLFFPKQQAIIFARYLIEHSNLQYVYTDDLNQHPRPIVKSILRALYGNYSIYQNKKEQFIQILTTLRNKLQLMLQSSTKGGLVSKDKFVQIIESLSIDCKSGFDIFCISKMVKHSQSVQKLKFKYLFEGMAIDD